jgi:hypothetical protein
MYARMKGMMNSAPTSVKPMLSVGAAASQIEIVGGMMWGHRLMMSFENRLGLLRPGRSLCSAVVCFLCQISSISGVDPLAESRDSAQRQR